jgi:glutamate racemase
LGRPINVLGIIVPTIEAATGLPWEHEAERRGDKVEQLDVLGVFSTQGTTNSRVYEIEIDKRKQDIAVFSQACPDLVPMIEADAGAVDLAKAVEGYVQALKTRIGRYPDRAVLGCTHYEIIADIFRAALPAGTPVIHQPASTADALELYLQRHPELDPGTGGARKFLTTGAPGPQNGLVEELLGRPAAVRRGLGRLFRSRRAGPPALHGLGFRLVEPRQGHSQLKTSREILVAGVREHLQHHELHRNRVALSP